MTIIFFSFYFLLSINRTDKLRPCSDIQEIITMLIVGHCYLTLRKLFLSRLLKPWNSSSLEYLLHIL